MSLDSDDDELKAAIALSLATSTPNGNAANSKQVDSLSFPQPATTISTSSGIPGLDRKAMEAERLARLSRKRERSISPPSTNTSRKTAKIESDTVTLPSGAVLRSFSTLVNDDQQARKSDVANAANKRLKPSPFPAIKDGPNSQPSDNSQTTLGTIQYPKGVVKKTWAFRHDRTGDEIKLEEVLEPQTLRTALLSAFQWDTNWVLAKLKTPLTGGSTKCAFVMQAKEDKLRQEMLEQTADWRKFLRLCFPSMKGQIHCMHSKLMLLFHPDKLRIAVPTANLLDFDWGESGVMENSVFMIDLPRLPDGRKIEDVEGMPFARELLYFLEKQDVDEDIRSGVLSFDFSGTAGMAFVHAVGGAHYDDDAKRTGLLGLSRSVRELALASHDNLEIDFAASSIGSLNDDYLRTFHAAARGECLMSPASEASSRAAKDFFKPQKSSATPKSASKTDDIRQKIRIYFPTHETVTSSTAGAAGTICLSRKWYESSTFPHQCFRDYKSTRAGLLSHNKIIYARGKSKSHYADPRKGKDIAWAYVGSANMSESAWGKLVYDQKAKKWKINCRNWECGVLLPVSQEVIHAQSKARETAIKKEKVPGEDSETESDDDGDVAIGSDEHVGFEVFDDIVKPPCEMPGERYSECNDPTPPVRHAAAL